MIAHFQLVYQVIMLIVDSAEKISNELKCFNRCMKSNKIRINADITKYIC